jgi:hypothetical protein
VNIPGYRYFPICRDQSKNGRYFGGLAILYKDELKPGIKLLPIMNRTLTLTGLSLKRIFFNLEKDIYTCLVYYPPVQSATLHNQDCTILDLIEKDIIKHQDYGNIMLCGDFNARVGCENYCITKDNNNFNPSFDCYVSDSARPRMSQDKITDTRDNHLIDICVGNQLRILNGRLAGDSWEILLPYIQWLKHCGLCDCIRTITF